MLLVLGQHFKLTNAIVQLFGIVAKLKIDTIEFELLL